VQIVSASWQVSVQVESAGELAALLTFAEDYYAEAKMTSMRALEATAVPMPLRVSVSYRNADSVDDIAASLGALHQLRLLTGQLSAPVIGEAPTG
jgi:hypothetical protein